MPKHVLFDFDGTLIDSSDSVLASFAGALAHCRRQPAVALERSLIGPPLRETMRRISGSSDDAVLDRLVEAFKRDYDNRGYLETRPYPGVEAALIALRDAGAELFIVTNKRMLPTTRILAHLGWEDLFRGVHALDAGMPPSPDKGALVTAVMRQWGIDTARAVMVGDTPEDLSAARQNGLTFAAACWGYGSFDGGMLAGVTRLVTPEDIARL